MWPRCHNINYQNKRGLMFFLLFYPKMNFAEYGPTKWMTQTTVVRLTWNSNQHLIKKYKKLHPNQRTNLAWDFVQCKPLKWLETWIWLADCRSHARHTTTESMVCCSLAPNQNRKDSCDIIQVFCCWTTTLRVQMPNMYLIITSISISYTARSALQQCGSGVLLP